MFERANRTIYSLRTQGIDIEHKIIPKRAHNDVNGKIGVNELGDDEIINLYSEVSKTTGMKSL